MYNFSVQVIATDDSENFAIQTFQFTTTNVDLIVNVVQPDVCVFMNTGQTGYIYRYSTAFTDPDNNYKRMKILPNDTVNF